jgi:endonuclease/exonuclease/phosphatase family metal-dependent hydrolase
MLRRILVVVGVLGVLLAGMVYLRSGGNVVVRGLPMGETSAPSAPFEFRVFMYNVQARPYFDDVKEKLPKISPLLNGFDIVGIEECFKEHELLWAGANYPNKVHFGSLVRPWKITNSGLATLTRLPMGEVLFDHYPHNLGELQNRVASKGIMLARLDAGGYPLDFYLTHMEAGGLPEAQVSRMAQAKQVVEFVTRNSPPEHAVLLCGDFNMMPLRKEKSPKEYSPGHFDSEADLHGRTAAFMVMYEGLGLRDASDELFGPTKDDIERYLFRAPKGVTMTALSLEADSTTFRREDGSSLSDGSPFIARFRLSR